MSKIDKLKLALTTAKETIKSLKEDLRALKAVLSQLIQSASKNTRRVSAGHDYPANA